MNADRSTARSVVFRRFPGSAAETDGSVPPTRTIYCAPGAGTGARSFLMPFARSPLRSSLRVVQLPGREDRLNEPHMDDIPEMAALIADAVTEEDTDDYALFGHSFGALVMLETARRLERIGAPAPALLAVAACAPPHLPLLPRFDEMQPAEIADVLRGVGGLDFGGPGGDELAALVLPSLAADCRALTRYLDTQRQGTIVCPILAMSGARDAAVTTEQMASWRDYTDAAFTAREYTGGHFFPVESESPLRAVVDWEPV